MLEKSGLKWEGSREVLHCKSTDFWIQTTTSFTIYALHPFSGPCNDSEDFLSATNSDAFILAIQLPCGLFVHTFYLSATILSAFSPITPLDGPFQALKGKCIILQCFIVIYCHDLGVFLNFHFPFIYFFKKVNLLALFCCGDIRRKVISKKGGGQRL